jgi:DNA-binding GntR family transcriptional regulator
MVTEITEKEVQDVYLIRTTLESLAIRIAAAKMTGKSLVQLEAIYNLMEKAAKDKDMSAYFKFNQEFHDKIMGEVDNDKLTKILKNLGKQTLRFRFFALSTPGRLDQSMENHRLLLAALKSRDADRASELRFEHIRSGGEILKTQISERFMSNSL